MELYKSRPKKGEKPLYKFAKVEEARINNAIFPELDKAFNDYFITYQDVILYPNHVEVLYEMIENDTHFSTALKGVLKAAIDEQGGLYLSAD